MSKTRFSVFSLAIATALMVSASAQAQTWTWQAGTSDVADAANWTPVGGPPGITAGVQGGRFAHFAATGSTSPTQGNVNYWLEAITFEPGAQAYTYTGNIAGAYLSLAPTLSTVDVISIENQSSNTQIFNMPSDGKIGVDGIIRATGGGGNLVINAPISVADGTTHTGRYTMVRPNGGNIYFNVDTSVNPNGNVNGGAWTATTTLNNNVYGNARGRTYFDSDPSDAVGGTVYLGNIGTTYRGTMLVVTEKGGKVQLTHNNSLGNTGGYGGTGTGNTAVAILGGNDSTTSKGNGTVQLTGNINVQRAVLWLGARDGAIGTVPHISNVSGTNSWTVGADWNNFNSIGTFTSTSQIAGNWNIESQAGKLTFKGGTGGGVVYNTANVNLTMRLTGNGDGQFDSQITNWSTNPGINIEKASGTGTWTLAHANNDYAGTTTINAGKIQVTGAYTGTGAWTVNSGGAVGGTGSIAAAVTVNSGGKLEPGTSPGTLTVNNTLSINSGSIWNYDLSTPGDTTDDQVTVNGAANFGGGSLTLNVAKIGGGNLGIGDYLLIDATSLTGTVPGSVTINAPLAGGTFASIFTDLVGSNIFLRVEAVPEPSTLALAGMGLIGLAIAYRRRRK